MTENIPVICLLDRYWDTAERKFAGTEKNGTLISISMQSAEDDHSKAIPVGVVLLEDNTFESVPLEFITKQTQTTD